MGGTLSLLFDLQPDREESVVSEDEELDTDEDAGRGGVEVEEGGGIYL